MPSSDRKSTRLNSSHLVISYAVFCSEEHTSELQSPCNLVCRLLLEKINSPRSATIYRCTLSERAARSSAPLPRLSVRHARSKRSAIFKTGCPPSPCFFINEAAPPKFPLLPPRVSLPI